MFLDQRDKESFKRKLCYFRSNVKKLLQNDNGHANTEINSEEQIMKQVYTRMKQKGQFNLAGERHGGASRF